MDRELAERLISSREVFVGRLIALHVDEVELANGTRATREIVSHPGAVAIVPFLPDGRVAMIRQYRHAAGRVLWELPAGVLEAGEAPEQCARRELAEEIGYQAGELKPLLCVYLSPGFSREVIHIFAARRLRKVEARRPPDEILEVAPLEFEQALSMVCRGEVQNAAAVCGLLAAAAWQRPTE